MDASDDTTNAAPSFGPPDRAGDGAGAVAVGGAGDRPFGPDAAAILATEHWSLLGTRALIWNDALSRATVFLTVLSASIITLALVLLPVVLLLGIATYMFGSCRSTAKSSSWCWP